MELVEYHLAVLLFPAQRESNTVEAIAPGSFLSFNIDHSIRIYSPRGKVHLFEWIFKFGMMPQSVSTFLNKYLLVIL